MFSQVFVSGNPAGLATWVEVDCLCRMCAEILGRLEEEANARKAAEKQVESAEHHVSMLEFDMKQKDSELERWKQQVG